MEEAVRQNFFSIAALTEKVMALVVNKELADIAPCYFEPGANLFVDTVTNPPPVLENTSASTSVYDVSTDSGVVASPSANSAEGEVTSR